MKRARSVTHDACPAMRLLRITQGFLTVRLQSLSSEWYFFRFEDGKTFKGLS